MFTRRSFLSALGAAAVAPQLRRTGKLQGLNVLYLCADEHNPRLLGGHPIVRTPNLDRLAGEGLRCTRTYVATPVCAPTRQAWLTGLHTWEHGQFGNRYVFDNRVPSLVQSFRSAGYRTTCLGKLHSWSEEVDGNMGFDRILNDKSGESWSAVRRTRRVTMAAPAFDVEDSPIYETMPQGSRFRGKLRPDPSTCDSWLLAQEAVAELRRNPGTTPFFLYLGVRAPHHPYDLPRDWYHRHDPADMPGAVGAAASVSPGTGRQADMNDWGAFKPEHHRLLQARYYASIEYMDHLMGLVLDELDALGLRESTLVVYMSDHGDMAGERGCWLKHTMFDSSARKPLILRGPGLRTGTYEHLVSEVDLLATVGGLVGVECGGRGKDLSGALLAGTAGRDCAFAADFISRKGSFGMTMARGPRYKLTWYRKPAFREEAFELFDLDEDPEETTDLAEDPLAGAVLQDLKERCLAWEEQLVPPTYPLRLRSTG